MAFWSSPVKKVTKEIIANDREWKGLMDSGDVMGMMEAMNKSEPLMAKLFDACLEDTTMSAFLKNNKLGKSDFMATYERLRRLGIGTPGIAMALTDPEAFSYVLKENNKSELQLKLIETYGTSW